MLFTSGHGVNNPYPFARLSKRSLCRFWLVPGIVSVLIFAVSFRNTLLFHALVELAAAAIALTMFVMVWYSYRYNKNHFLLFLGIGYGWVACIDLAHTLAFKGIGLFPGDSNHAVQLWVLARYCQALLLLVAPMFLSRCVSRRRLNTIFGSVAVVSVFWAWSGYFPNAYIEGQGLTRFKIVSEYVIIVILLAALAGVYVRRRLLDPGLAVLIGLSILTMAVAEYMSTLYVEVDETAFIAGHLVKLLSYWLLFVGIAQVMFVGPSQALASNAAIFENLPMPIVVVGEDGIIYQGNLPARRAAGGAEQDIRGLDCHDIFHSQSVPREECPICTSVRSRIVIDDFNMHDESNGTWTSYTLSLVDTENPAAGVVHVCRDVTHRKLLETEALETQASFELIVEMAPEAIISINDEQRIILFNKSAETMFDYAQDEILGQKIDILIPDSRVERHRKHVENFIDSNQRTAPMRGGIGISGRQKSGALFSAEAGIIRQDRQTGTILTVILRDTSAQVDREQRLRRSEERFRTLSDLASDWVWETDADLRFTYLSHQFDVPQGLSADSIIGKTRQEFAKPDPGDENWQRHLDDMENHLGFRNFRYNAAGDDGEQIYFNISGAPQFDDDGEFIGYIGTGRDVTALKQDGLESERQKILFETIVNGIPNALVFTNSRREIIAANPGFEKIFGYSPEEVIGRTTEFLFADPDFYETSGGRYLNSSMPMDGTELLISYRRKSGETFKANVVGTAVRDSLGNIRGLVALITDVTDQVMIEQQLRQSQKMEAVGQLTGGIAHDFNNLLTIIIGNLRLLEDEHPGSRDLFLSELLTDTLSAAKDGAELTSRLLAYSRKSALDPADQGLDTLIEGVMALASRVLREDIVVKYDAAEADVGLFVDKTQFDGALLNLLLNSQDAMPDGGEIELKSDVIVVSNGNAEKYATLMPGKYVAVHVIDNGAGMTQQALDSACEPFFTTKRHGHGTGLGLSTVLGFTRQSGGDFRLTSKPGDGATAIMYFPFVRMGATLEPFYMPDTESNGEADPKQDRLVILVTEDDDDVRKVITHILQAANHRVLQASSGEEAKKVIAEHPEIGVLISDVIMPGGINGYELADWTHTRHPGIRILMATGYDKTDKEGLAVTSGDHPVLRKPFTPEKLIESLTALLSA